MSKEKPPRGMLFPLSEYNAEQDAETRRQDALIGIGLVVVFVIIGVKYLGIWLGWWSP